MPKAPAKSPAKPTESIKPEFLPVDLGGGDIRFIKRSDYARRTAEILSLKFKAEFKKDHITSALDLLDQGKTEVPGEPPEEFVKMFELVNEDYQAAVSKVQEDAAKAEEDKATKELEEKEKKDFEENLYIAVKDSKASFSDLAESFDTGENLDRFIARPGTTDEALFAALNSGFDMKEFSGWMIGDLVLELQKRGKDNVVARISENKGHSLARVYNYAKTARSFPPGQRAGACYTIFEAIGTAKFSEEQKKGVPALLEDVKDGKHTSQTIREAVNKLKGKEAPDKKPPEEDEKFVFIAVDPNADDIERNLVNTVIGFPRDLYENGSIIINPKTVKQFGKNAFAKKPENRWVDLVEYKKASAEQAASTKKNGKKKK